MEGEWTLDELKIAYQAALDIETYVNDITDGNGLAWMNEYLGNIDISISTKSRGSALPGNVYLPSKWENSSNPGQYLAHELGHIWDIRTGGIGLLGATMGVGDYLNSFIGGDIIETVDCRFCDGTGKNYIPEHRRFKSPGSNPYGNNSTADYAAEAFGWSIYNPSYVPSGVERWIKDVIYWQAKELN